MPKIKVRPIFSIPTDLFSFKDNTFVVEDSTIRANRYEYSRESLILFNPKTGNSVGFRYNGNTDYDHSGEDVTGWWFNSVNPQFPDLKVLIIND